MFMFTDRDGSSSVTHVLGGHGLTKCTISSPHPESHPTPAIQFGSQIGNVLPKTQYINQQ